MKAGPCKSLFCRYLGSPRRIRDLPWMIQANDAGPYVKVGGVTPPNWACHWGMYLPESWPIVTWFWDRLLELMALHQRCRHRGYKNLCNHDTYGYLVTLELYIWGGGFPPNHRHISFRCLVISSCSCLCSYCPAAFLIFAFYRRDYVSQMHRGFYSCETYI